MSAAAAELSQIAQPLTGSPNDYDGLLELIGEARFVLLGEATHGTHEFYRERAQITKRLVSDRGFQAVAVEADWPDAFAVNTYVRGTSGHGSAAEALGGFKRFPQWMWRNADVLDFVGWLREHNARVPHRQCGFYGLDLYSLHASIEAVLGYLKKVDPEAAEEARRNYSCFDRFDRNTESYGWATTFARVPDCEKHVVDALVSVRRKAMEYRERDGQFTPDVHFSAQQNALIVRNAEQYYRTMFQREDSSWNQRDSHMMESLVRLTAHLEEQGAASKVIVWAHNSHLGDARATQMGARGELNVGQLVRERFAREAVLIGFSTYSGSVTAASDWDGPAERKSVRAALRGSYEDLFHRVEHERFWINLRDSRARAALEEERLERAIGVIYRPETERQSHYFYARLAEQFDAVLHFDKTRAVEPLERTPEWQREVDETFPTGL